MKLVIPSTGSRDKKWIFRPLDMIFGGNGLEIDTYKPPKCIESYHTHVAESTNVNQKWSRDKYLKIKPKMSKNINIMFWVVSNSYERQNVSNG